MLLRQIDRAELDLEIKKAMMVGNAAPLIVFTWRISSSLERTRIKQVESNTVQQR
jgi:hypothetical protein